MNTVPAPIDDGAAVSRGSSEADVTSALRLPAIVVARFIVSGCASSYTIPPRGAACTTAERSSRRRVERSAMDA
jgi:hypothetical protein